MVSVGVHTTYTKKEAAAVVSKVACRALLCMGDLMLPTARTATADRWIAVDLVDACSSLSLVVAMDMPREFVRARAACAANRSSSGPAPAPRLS